MTKKVFSTFLKILVLILFYDISTGGDGCMLKGPVNLDQHFTYNNGSHLGFLYFSPYSSEMTCLLHSSHIIIN